MKLHLPHSLRKALMAVLASSAYFTTAEAGCMHAGVSPTIYTDFGQNMGRYSVYQVNELLTAITARDGILIPYTTGAEPGKLDQKKMISFEGMNNDGAFTAVGYNYTATVAHNGCPNPSFTPRYLGEDQAIHYQGVEYRSSQNKAFLLQPNIDYKLTRSSKIFTDITASGVFDTRQYLRDGGSVLDLVHYRAGAGSQEVADFDGNTHGVAGGYAYITGGVVATLGFSYQDSSYDYNTDYEPGQGPRDVRGVIDDPYTISVHGIQDYGPGGAGQPTPDNPRVYLLPFVSRGGDSGSPVWAWDAVDEEYKLISCHQARGGDNSYSRGASQWTIETMESFNKNVDMEAAGNTVTLHEVRVTGESREIYDDTNKVGTITQFGSITGADGAFGEVSFCGVGPKEAGTPVYTWLSLYDQKDVQNWYSYGNTYFNANGNGSGKQMHLGDLFNTENIVFKSDGSAVNTILLDADIDMGIGYAQFTPKEEGPTAKFYLQSKENVLGRDYMLNSAGYIVDEGAELHIQVTNTQTDSAGHAYFREWRKQGAGDMYLEGRGNNEVFLNLGGKGTTFLHETGGYAAYNVLINNGATLDFGGDITQIARDVTFGNGGGYLEFSGLSSFDWYSGENANVEAEGFTINALTQDATLVNSTGSTTLHYKTGGETTFLGSFQDTDSSRLNVIYEGGGTWTLNSIHTKLHDGSVFTVANGTVELAGTNTVHALGSIEGRADTRYSHPDDWHYADAEMDVVVQRNATFRLGSHARLTGDVTVQTGGILEIAEGVKHRFEYIEGWLIAEDTTSDFYRGFYGLKGNVNLAENSTLRFNYSEGTDAENVYGGNITGAGNVDLQLGGSGATLVLSGNNTFSGTKHLSGGGLVAEHETALGNTAENKWLVNKDAFIAVKGSDGNQALQHIDSDSTGVIALTQDQTDEVVLNGTGHQNMIVGALAGQVVQYGEAPVEQGHKTTYTEERLSTVELDGHRKWQLGGGGGELVVNFLLEDSGAELVLGNEYTTGTVTLTNIWNQIGSINFAGQVTLNYTSEEALGGSKISLGYANRVIGTPSLLKSITRSSDGVLLLDKMPEANVDLTDHHFMALGSDGDMVYSGNITPTSGGYRFGGITGTLELQTALTDGEGETRGLIVDGQGYAGGTLALATKATLTGDIVVTGHDTDRHPEFSGGDIALRLDVDDAIADARSITLKAGGSIDINGTSQTFRSFNMEEGGALVDSSELWNGSAVVDVAVGAASRLGGNVDVYSLTKTGQGDMVLGGSNNYGVFFIREGRVVLENGNALSATGTAMLESGGVLDASGVDISAAIGFAGGTLQVGTKRVAGSLAVAVGYDGTVQQNGTNITTSINSDLQVAQGATLKLSGEHGNFNFSAEEINESGGTIALEGNRIALTNGKEMTVGGVISLKARGLSNDERVTLYSTGSADNMIRNINELHIESGQKAGIAEESWNTIWNIHSLTGDGDLQWTSNTTHWYSARVVLDGANSFTGQFTARRTYGNVSNRGYQSFVEARHDLAMQNMDVSLIGNGAQSNMALAVNTDNLQMRSLSGNTNALLYAGAALEGADHDTGNPLQAAPQSTRRATLTITGGGDHTFSGNVTGQDHYEGYETREDGSRVKVADVTNAGISLVMNGSGTQTFNGGSTRFNNVTVNSGKLALTSAGLTIMEDVSIKRGAELQLSQAYELGSGKTLTVLANDADASSTAKLSGLALNGGTLIFSAEGLSATTPALSLASLSGNTVAIDFSETYALTSGVQYYLADRDWQNVNISSSTTELSYLSASFIQNSSGLYVTFNTKEGNFIWSGTDASHTWSSSTFGPSSTVPSSEQTAVFNDAAANKNVNISGTVNVGSMVFDAAGDYSLASSDGGKVTAGKIIQSGTGTTTLSDAVAIGSAQEHGTVEINNGELVVTSASTLANVAAITGEGTLGVNFGSGSGTVSALFAEGSSVGALHVVSGTFTAGGAASYETLVLDKGATYQLGADQSLNMVVGTGEREGTATLNLANHKITSGTMEMQGDLTVMGGGTLNAAVVSNGHTVNTQGTLTIGNSNFDAGLSVAEYGKVILTGGAFGKMGDITLGSSSTLQLDYGAGITSGASIAMGEGSTLNLRNGAGDSTQVNADIVMTGNGATIMGSIYGNGTRVSGSILGQGTLHLAKTDGTNSWRVDSTIAETEDRPLALDINSNVTLAGANSYSGGTTITGFRTTTDNVRALGTGTLAMNGGELYLNRDLAIGGLEGSGGNILLNNKQITIDNAGNTRYSGDISGGSLVKLGGGSLELASGGAFSHVTVEVGTLALASSNIDGKISVAQGATLDITGEYYAISRAVDNAGTVHFSNAGTMLDLGIGAGFEVHTNGYRDVDGQVTDSGNGFAQGVTVQVFNNAEGAAITGTAPEIFYLGDSMVLDAATGVASKGASNAAYSVRTGTVVYDDAFAAKDAAQTIEYFSLEGHSMDEPATLRLSRNLADGVGIMVSNYGGNIDLDQGVVLSADRLEMQSYATLTGGGTFVLDAGSSALPDCVLLGNDEQWTGAVRISGMSFNGTDITGLATPNSSVEMYGITGGYLKQWQGTLNTNIRLTDTESGAYAWKWTDGQSSGASTITFNGMWEGSGTFAMGGAGKNQNFTFKGDISAWTGKYIQVNNNSDVTFASTGEQRVNADFERQKGTLNLIVGNGSAATNATFNGNLVDVSSLQVKAASSATLAGTHNTLGSLTVESGAALTNTGSTVLSGSLANSGSITNSGALDLGASADSVGSISNSGTLTIGTKLTGGAITNSGTIVISSLMTGSVSGYVDANGQRSGNGNGFATTTLTVRESGATITNNGGRILYGGNDVTSEVLTSGTITSQVNHGTYFIKTTDDSVTYSAIAAKAGDALEYISFKDNTQLRVDNGETSHLHTSQVKVDKFATTNPTLNMETGSTLVVDASTTAKVNAAGGSTITLEMAGATPETRMTLGGFTPNGATVNVTGSGVLDIGGGQYNISTLNITGGTVLSSFAGNGGSFSGLTDVNITQGGRLQLAKVDALGWASNLTKSINIAGDETATSALELGFRQTLSGTTAINMNGNAVIRAMAGYTGSGENLPMLDAFNNTPKITATGTGNIVAVPLRMRTDFTFDIAANGELTLAGGTASGYRGHNIVKNGGGKLIFDELQVNFGEHTYEGGLNINAGSVEVKADATFATVNAKGALAVMGGTTTITAYTGSNGAAITVGRGAELALNGNATLAAAISNSGTVSFGADCTTLTLNGNFEHADNVYRDLATGEISENGNGLLSGGYVTVLSGDGNVTLHGNVDVSYNSKTYALQTDGRAYLGSDATTYYVRTGKAVYNSAVAAESAIKTVALSGGATMDMQVALADGVEISSTGGTVNIGSGVLLSRESVTAANATALTGSGTYELDLAKGTTRGDNISLGDAWNGTLRLTGATSQTVNLNTIASRGNSYATLQLAGAAAELQTGDIINPALQLSDLDGGAAAFTIRNAGEFTFRGDISGSGRMVNSAGGSSSYTYSGGDLTNWSGAIVNNGGTLNVAVSGKAGITVLNAALERVNSLSFTAGNQGDTLTVASLQTNDNGTVVNGAVAVSNLSGGGALTVNGSVELAGGEYGGSSITLGSVDATLTLGGVDASAAVLHANGGNVVLKADSVSVAGLDGTGRVVAADSQPHTLALHGGGNYSSGASIGSNIDLEMNGGGTQTLTGDLSAFNGDIYTVNGTLRLQQSNATTTVGVLNMSGGTVEFGANKTVLDAARVVSGATAAITVENGAGVVLNRSIQNSGSLTLSGTLDVGNLTLSRMDTGFIDTEGRTSADGSGFVASSDSVRVVRNIGDGSLVADDAKAYYKGEIVAISRDGLAVLNSGYAVAADTYYVRDAREDAVAYSAIAAKAEEHGGALAHLVFDREDAYMTLDSQVDQGVFSVEDASVAHVEVAQDGRLDMDALSAGVDGSMLLNGAGRVQIEDRAGLARNVQLTDGWQGTVALTGSSTGVNLGADSGLWVGSRDAASTVEFDNWHGTLAAPASDVDVTQIDANVVINGMTLDESATGANLAFNNTVSGRGDLVNNSGADLYMEFYGDTSRWNGSLVTNSGSTTLLLLAEHAEVNNAILKGDNGNVTVSTMGAVRFNSQVQADMLVAGYGEVIILSDFTVRDVSIYDNLTVGHQGRLSISGDVDGLTVPISNSGAISFTGEAVQSILLGSSADFEFSDVQYTDLDHSSSATGNGFRTGGSATLIQMGRDATLEGAENVIVSYRDQLYTLLDDGSFGDRYGEHTYYIHQGTVNYSDVKDVSGLVGLHLDNTLVQGGNATLNLDVNLASTVTNGIVSDGGTVNIGQGVTLQRDQLDAQGATKLTGQGVYDLGSGVSTLGDNVSLDTSHWSGTVRISDAHMSPFTLSNYANDHSSVEVLGISGWWNTGITNFYGKLILGKDDAQPEKVALKLTDASSNYTYSLNGGVSGRGDYVLAYDSNKRISATTHVISGDVSDWTGSFIDAVEQTNQANTTTLKFLNNTAVGGVVNINANILDRSSGADHKLNVYVDQTAGRINMNGTLAGIDKLTYKANGSGRVLHIENLTTNAAGTMLEFENGNYPSTIEVNNLGGTGILSLHNNNKATGLANFAINGGDYSGERIDFTAMKSGYSDSNRCVLLTIGDERVAEHSVIHTSINKTGGGSVNVGIAVNDDTVRVGGLTDDAYNVSGTCVYSLVSGNPTNHTNPDNTGFTSDGTVRTLVIVGNGGTTRAKVGANLNITMDSAGHTQSFTGDMGAFTGAIDVQSGTLNITSTGALSLHAVNVEEGGTLAIAGAADLYETITNNGTLTMNSIASIDHLAISELSGFEDGQDSVHNGFLVAEKVEVARMGEGAVLNVSTGPTSYKGKDGTFDAKTGIFSVGTTVCDNATFYVNTAGSQESLSHAVAKAQERGGQLTRLQMRGGTALDVSGLPVTIDTLAIEQRGDSAPSVITGGEVSFNNLALEGAVSAVAVEEGAKLKVNNIIEVAANLTLATSGEGTFEAATLRSTGGRVELGGTTLVSGGGDGRGSSNNKLGLAITSNNGTIAVNGGATTVTGAVYTNAQNTTIEVGTAGQDATLVATRMELGDNGGGAGTLTVGDNGKVVVTGAVNNRGDHKNVSLLLGEWGQAYTSNVQGQLLAKDAIAMLGHDHAQSVNVQGGTMAVKGVWSISAGGDKNHNLSVTDGGRLILGESGIAAESGNWNIKVQDSEIGMTADTTIGRAVKLVGNVTVNTDKYEFKGTGSAQEVVQGASAGKMTVSGAVNADASATLSKAGAGALEISGSMAGFHGSIDARGGVLELLNQNRLDVQDVTIADGATVSAYVGTNKLDEYESTLTISGTLAAKGANGKLNANVVMETGSTLDASATGGKGIALGSSLTIMENIHLSDADFEAVAGLGYGESYILFNGVDSLTLDQTYTGEITPEMKVDATGWFHGVEPEHIYMVYDGSNVGLYCYEPMPEPATSTLSLLALAALAARRRRK